MVDFYLVQPYDTKKETEAQRVPTKTLPNNVIPFQSIHSPRTVGPLLVILEASKESSGGMVTTFGVEVRRTLKVGGDEPRSELLGEPSSSSISWRMNSSRSPSIRELGEVILLLSVVSKGTSEGGCTGRRWIELLGCCRKLFSTSPAAWRENELSSLMLRASVVGVWPLLLGGEVWFAS